MILITSVILWNYILDKICPKPGNKFREMINYLVWFGIAWYGEIYYLYTGDITVYSPTIAYFYVYSINVTYIYDLLRYPTDKAHCIHHIVTILTQYLYTYSDFASSSPLLRMVNTSHKGLLSSVISAARAITKQRSSPYEKSITKLYYYSYLICKIGGILLYYYHLCQYHNEINYNMVHIILLFLYSLVHIIQIYFSAIIIRILRGNKRSD